MTVSAVTEQILLANRDSTELVTISTTESVVISNDEAVTIITGMMGPRGIAGRDGIDGVAGALSQIPDVDITQVTDGSFLTYSASVGKWLATTSLTNQILEAGQY